MALEELVKAAKSMNLDRKKFLQGLQKQYNDLFEGGFFHELDGIHTLTGINAELPAGLVQKRYKEAFKDDNLDNMEFYLRVTGIRPDIETSKVQKKYALYVARGDVDDIKKLQAITGIAPQIPESAIQEGYRNCSRYALTAFEALIGYSGVKPKLSKSHLNETYMEYAKDKDAERVAWLERMTGTKAPQQAYQKLVRRYVQGKDKGNIFTF